LLTKPSIRQAQVLTDEEYKEKLNTFQTLLPKMDYYIHSQAYSRGIKLPDNLLETEDFVNIGRVQTWAAVLSWEPSKGTLENWCKRRIWTNMNVVISARYQRKRLSYTEDVDGIKEIVHSVSLFSDTPDGSLLLDTLEDMNAEDPIDTLLEEELYSLVKNRLLFMGDRVAAAVFRLSLGPDNELFRLCEEYAVKGHRRKVKVINKALATRLGVSASRISTAKSVIKAVIGELSI